MTVIIFIIILAILIFTHELGHFSAAKKFGIRVDEFGFGFPPKLLSFKKGETEYSINLIPIGGFVKIFGENSDEESESGPDNARSMIPVSYTHLRAHETVLDLVCRLLLEKKKALAMS